ncbi:hypothetical protein PVK06_039838 [Gossypium arboreum]|uniref:ABC transporter domain-containing protein n=1 Tax=Gossypium arboreum TaxID=29729 RepID=A0ABR0N465_GOSAR|nr:hypothetical protein PVK06_039838 [Gossypium arboreum]
MGQLNFFLGIEMQHTSLRVFLSQKKYILEILAKTSMVGATATLRPMLLLAVIGCMLFYISMHSSYSRYMAYVTQDDTLMTTLTIREAVFYSAQLQLPDSMSVFEKKERAEMAIREMGLQDSMDTRIGGWSTKGLSGGQKRRLSICIEIITWPKLLFLDEPTSGLDSAASYHVMN